MTPNNALHPTAKRLRRLVPVAHCAPAAGEGKRWAAAVMRHFASFATLLFAANLVAAAPVSKLWEDPFLRPYVAQLKTDTPAATLETIKTMAEGELILFHMGYGTWVRNRWLWGNREPSLVQFFRVNGVDHPDDMSMVLIRALWEDLNRGLSPAERAAIDAKRALVAAKRVTYDKLRTECATHLATSEPVFKRCYAAHGLPSENPQGRDPFFKLIVDKTGAVNDIVFFDGASGPLKHCLRQTIEQYRFSPFGYDPTLTLYIVAFPNCGVSEANRLH